MKIPFLTARWTNLILANYSLDPAFLQPFVPPGCTLDLLEGKAFASLVAFDFTGTRVLGVAWPGFVRFPEINLRIYVRHRVCSTEHRGVCFIREYVPVRTVAALAHWLYNEPYEVAPMTSRVIDDELTILVKHTLIVDGSENSVAAAGLKQSCCPLPDSAESFFKDHEWGYGTSRRGRLIRYQVQHPLWNIHPVQSFELDWDWQSVYGPHWAFMQNRRPESVILAEGSAVKVFPWSLPLG